MKCLDRSLMVSAALIAVACLPAHADDAEDRARLGADRARIEAAWAEREHECQGKFAVSSCLDDARRERRTALERVHREQLALDEAARKQRSAERLEEIRARMDDAARKQAAAASSAASAPVSPKPPRAASAPVPTPPPVAKPVAHPIVAPARASASAKRQASARAHRAAVERRNAERAASGKAAKPLPTPQGASASK